MSRRVALLAAPLFALQFLTLAPPIIRRRPSDDELGAADAFFPAIGLALGALVAFLDRLLADVLAPSVRDVLAVGALTVLTGAIHLDGLADTCDGLFGGSDPASRLDIMRDPRTGAFGVVGVTLAILLKVAALGSVPPDLRFTALAIAPCLGRWAIVQSTWTFPYARPQGLGRSFKDRLRREHVALAALTAAGGAGWLLGPPGLAWFVAASIGTWLAGRAIAARMGGLTGDVYGALCELAEISTLVALGAQRSGLAHP